jgi:uncharacterized membrane protein
MKTIPFFAMHGHFGGGIFDVLFLVLIIALVVAYLPDKGGSK